MASTTEEKTGAAGTALGIALKGKKDEATALYAEVKDLGVDQQRERVEDLRAYAPFSEDIAYLVAELDGLAAQYSDKPAHQQPQTGKPVSGDEVRKELSPKSDKKPVAVSAKGDDNPKRGDADVTTKTDSGKVDAKDTTADDGSSSKPRRGHSGKKDTDDRRPRQRNPFIIVFATMVSALIALLRREPEFEDVGPRKGNLLVSRQMGGRTRIQVIINERSHDVIVPGAAVPALLGALEAEIPGVVGHGIELHWFDDDNLRITAPDSSRRNASPPREDRERRPARQPGTRSDSPSLRTDGDFRSSELPSPRSGPSKPSVTPRTRHDKPKSTTNSKPSVPAAKFPSGFQRTASSAIAQFLSSGNSDLGIEVTSEMLHGDDVTAESLEIDNDGIIRDVRWVHIPVCEAMTAAYVGEHPLAPMMDQKGRTAKLRDREGIPALRVGDKVFIAPFTQDAANIVKLTVNSVLMACASIVRAADWMKVFDSVTSSALITRSVDEIKATIRIEADVRNVQKSRLTSWLDNTYGEGKWVIDGNVVISTVTATGLPAKDFVLMEGPGLNFESVKHAFEGQCEVAFSGCEGTSNTVLHGFGRVWTACKSCKAGFFDALNQSVANRLNELGIGAFSVDPLGPADFIHEWPRISDPESLTILTPRADGSWPSWIPKNDDEADSRFMRDGPFVVTGPRSWGFDALSGRYEMKLTHVAVLQLEDDVFEAYPVSEKSASALVSADMATVGRQHKVGDNAIFLVDRSGALDRRPQTAQQKRAAKERFVEKKVSEKFDMTSDEKEEAAKKRDDRRADQRANRSEVKEELKSALGWYTSNAGIEHQEAQAEMTSGNKKKGRKSTEKAEADRARTAAAKAKAGKINKKKGGSKKNRKGGGDSPNDPAVEARLQAAARGEQTGGPVLQPGMGGMGVTVTRGRAVPGKKDAKK